MAKDRISFDRDTAQSLLNTLLRTNGDARAIAKLRTYLSKQGVDVSAAVPVAQLIAMPAPQVATQSTPEPVEIAEPQDADARRTETQPETITETIFAISSPLALKWQRSNVPTPLVATQSTPEPVEIAEPQDADARRTETQPETITETITPEPVAVAACAVKQPEAINLATLPPYVPQNGEVGTVKTAIRAGLNIGLRGAAGCGKTHLVQSVAKELGCAFYEIVCDGGTQREDVIGSRGYDGTQTYWIDGTATRALRHAQTAHVILYIDEPTCLRDDVQSALYPIMDDRRHVVLPENNGEIVQATRSINGSAGLTVISSWNDGYRGTQALNEAFADRYDVGISLDYLAPEREAKLLIARTGIDAAHAKTITEIAARLREAMRNKEIVTPISTRGLLAFAALVVAGFDVRTAGEHTLVEKANGMFETERQVIRDVIHTHTAGAVTA